MNRFSHPAFFFIISIILNSCGGNKTNPDPDNTILDKEAIVEEIMAQESSQDLMVALLYEFEETIEDIENQVERLQNRIIEKEAIVEELMAQESSKILPVVQFEELEENIRDNQRQILQLQTRVAKKEAIVEELMAQGSSQRIPAVQFYELEKTMEEIQSETTLLQTQVREYTKKSLENNYTEKLKKLIDEHLPIHKIYLNNGSVIEGTIENDLVDNIMVKTDVGRLTINKNEIENIEDLILSIPDIIFIGHGQEEIIDNYHFFTGKVLNKGGRRGDFVRIIYQLWGENTQIINSDSVFVVGSQIRYKSGIVTDTALEPNQSAYFNVKVSSKGEIPVSYVTRQIRWLSYD